MLRSDRIKIRCKAVLSAAAAVLCLCLIFTSDGVIHTFADTQSQLEARQAELEKERANVEADLKKYKGDAAQTQQYLDDYNEKMRIQEEQIENIEEQIKLYEEEIASLSAQIDEKNAEIENDVEKFRQRLRALYIAGNDSYASVLAGATDFYDILARIELVQRVSKHDNDMIEDINFKIASLNTDKADYEEKITALESKKAQEEVLYEELRETYNNHAETKAAQEAMIADYKERADEIQAEQEQVEKELQAEIRRLQEEAERKRKEEEERKRKEEERKRQEAVANGTTYVPDTTTSVPGYSETGFIWPVPTVRNMSDGYGNRWIVEEQRSNFHKGIDITKPGCGGEAVVASAAGTVIQAGDNKNGYGKCVIIDHGNSIATLYAHNSSVAVSVGDEVKQGQVIAYIGHTGYAYGDHSHFEVRVNGQHTNPLDYVSMNN